MPYGRWRLGRHHAHAASYLLSPRVCWSAQANVTANALNATTMAAITINSMDIGFLLRSFDYEAEGSDGGIDPDQCSA
jgi:hypothetical protein